MALISFVIPFYNRYDLLHKAIRSILNSAFKDVEIILIDDASYMEGFDDLLGYVAQFKNMKYIRQEKNSGPGAARNRGLDVAKGKWVFFMDSDDVIYGDVLPELARFLEKEHGTDMVVMGLTAFAWPDGRKEMKRFVGSTAKTVDEAFKNQNRAIDTVWNFCFNRVFLTKNNIHFLELYSNEDGCFTITSYCYAEKISCFKGCLYEYHFYTTLSLNTQIEQFDYLPGKIIDGLTSFFDNLLKLLESSIPMEKKNFIEHLIYRYILHSQWEKERYKNNEIVNCMLDRLHNTITDYSDNFTRPIYITPCFQGAFNAALLLSDWGARIAGFIDSNPASPRALSCKKVSGLNIYNINEIERVGGEGILIFSKHAEAIAERFNAMSLMNGRDFIKTGLL